MENLLRKQLALIKSRAIMLARRAPQDPNPIVDDLIRSGAVTRASALEPTREYAPRSGDDVMRSPRRRWWWRRRERMDPVERATREAAFETEFQRVLDDIASGEVLSIEHAVPGVARAIEGASYYLVRSVGAEIDPIAPREAAQFADLSSWPSAVSRAMVGRFVRRGYDAPGYATVDVHAATPFARGATPRSILFLDIETAGLSANTYVFLCGLMYLDPASGHFHAEQIFARDYAEEEGLLLHVRAALERFGTVVTYNGASFDMPFLRTRMAVHRIPDIVPMGSVDLLHATRRVYRPMLPNVRLVTVEQHLRGCGRVDDIPSRFIPRAYHEYVRTQDARIMRNVVYHNRMDLFTMAVILNRLDGIPSEVSAALVGTEKPMAAEPRA
jgi:uncharacterized protein YprB with RNaseH-like and TPR domain